MEFEKLNKKLEEQSRSSNNTFTNEDEIRYPTEDDLVDIKVLNNNIRLLDETKAGGTDLENVARETTPKNIENIVKATQSTTSTINSNVSNIKSTVDTINSNVNNINSNISSNLQGVAKERSQYSIEDKTKEISTKTDTIITNLQNVAKETSPKNIENMIKQVQTNVQTLLETKGSIKKVQRISGNFNSDTPLTVSIDAVDLNKTIVIPQGFNSFWDVATNSGATYSITAVISILAYLSSTNQLTIKRVGEKSSYQINTIEYDIQVIEFY